MTNDSSLFRDLETLEAASNQPARTVWRTNSGEYVALLEGKLFNLFDHRHGTFEGVPRASRFGIKAEPNHLSPEQKKRPDNNCLPRYWVPADEARSRYTERLGFEPSGVLAFRDVCRSHTDQRTVRACICPPYGAGNKAPLFLFLNTDPAAHAKRSALLCANLASFALDYVARQKFSGGSLNKFIIIQFPVIELSRFDQSCQWACEQPGELSLLHFILPRVLELTYTTQDLGSFAEDCGYRVPPFVWNDQRRFELRCELDAVFFHLYLPCDTDGRWQLADGETPARLESLKQYFSTPRAAIVYVMDQFPIVRQKDEQAHGCYRTKDRILEIYDALLAAQRSGRPFQTQLEPPPGEVVRIEGLPECK